MVKVLIRGAGDLATGVGITLKRSGFKVLMTEVERPMVIRRSVAFANAVFEGSMKVEDETAVLVTPDDFTLWLKNDIIGVMVDPEVRVKEIYQPEVIVDATLAKKNLGNKVGDAPIVIALGPGIKAGQDCDLVIETKRGHYLGSQIREGYAIANTGIPGVIGGYGLERVIKAPVAGVVKPIAHLGDLVKEGDPVMTVGEEVVRAAISGCLRGIIYEGMEVPEGMKIGDIDPRGIVDYCYSVSDKAYSIGRSVLEGILRLGIEKKLFGVKGI